MQILLAETIVSDDYIILVNVGDQDDVYLQLSILGSVHSFTKTVRPSSSSTDIPSAESRRSPATP